MSEVRYDLTAEQKKRLKYWHYHGNDEMQDTARFGTLNDMTRSLARAIMILSPAGRHQSLALTALEDVRMRVNAAIAVDECIIRADKKEAKNGGGG